MKEIFSKRLKNARLAAGFSQDDLVKAMNSLVSKNAISKYEKGLMMADGKVIISLANALNVKPDYFLRPFTIEIERVEFRKKSKLSVKKVDSIKQKVTDVVERYLEVEQFLSIESSFENPISSFKITNGEEVENAVNRLLEIWKIGYNAIPNVIELLEDKEIKVIEVEAPDEFDGFSGWANGKYPVIVINKHYTIERKRLTALHELGHLLLSFDTSINHKDIERLCFRFAAAMLIPVSTIINELGPYRGYISMAELIGIKENYGISIQALMHRAKELGIIKDMTYINFRKRINKNRSEDGLGKYSGAEKS
ncbi:MAG: XRE family transcriptional regulator, partial [Reichenbachiella sp.]